MDNFRDSSKRPFEEDCVDRNKTSEIKKKRSKETVAERIARCALSACQSNQKGLKEDEKDKRETSDTGKVPSPSSCAQCSHTQEQNSCNQVAETKSACKASLKNGDHSRTHEGTVSQKLDGALYLDEETSSETRQATVDNAAFADLSIRSITHLLHSVGKSCLGGVEAKESMKMEAEAQLEREVRCKDEENGQDKGDCESGMYFEGDHSENGKDSNKENNYEDGLDYLDKENGVDGGDCEDIVVCNDESDYEDDIDYGDDIDYEGDIDCDDDDDAVDYMDEIEVDYDAGIDFEPNDDMEDSAFQDPFLFDECVEDHVERYESGIDNERRPLRRGEEGPSNSEEFNGESAVEERLFWQGVRSVIDRQASEVSNVPATDSSERACGLPNLVSMPTYNNWENESENRSHRCFQLNLSRLEPEEGREMDLEEFDDYHSWGDNISETQEEDEGLDGVFLEEEEDEDPINQRVLDEVYFGICQGFGDLHYNDDRYDYVADDIPDSDWEEEELEDWDLAGNVWFEDAEDDFDLEEQIEGFLGLGRQTLLLRRRA